MKIIYLVRNLKSLFSYRLMYYLFVRQGDVLNNYYPDCITNSGRAVEPKTLSKLLAVCHTSSIYIVTTKSFTQITK